MGDPGAPIGKSAGPITAGTARVPLSGALPAYAAQATTALDRLDLPPSVRDLVAAYFKALSDG